MSDYERGYKQGVEDAHRCEQRHAQIDQLEADVRALRAENARLREALETIARYGKDGICQYGCDTPYIAQAALQPKEVQP